MAEFIYAGDGGAFKACTKCGEILPLGEFTRSRGAPFDRRTYCRPCGEVMRAIWVEKNPNYPREWYEKNKEHADAVSLAWQRANPGKVKESWKRYYEKNKDTLAKKNKERRHLDPDKTSEANKRSLARQGAEKRRKLWAEWYARFGKERNSKAREIPSRRIDDAISHGIWRSLNGGKAGRTWESLAGYTLDDLLLHLESKFLPGMSFDNYGRDGWEVDHIIPRSAFNYKSAEDIDFKRCWALENLQPLWRKDNQSKGAKLSEPFQPSLAM